MQMAVASVLGRLGGNPQSLASAYAPELALTRAILFGYPVGQSPRPPPRGPKSMSPTLPITADRRNTSRRSIPVNFGGMATNAELEPSILSSWNTRMGKLPASEVGWGQLSRGRRQSTRTPACTTCFSIWSTAPLSGPRAEFPTNPGLAHSLRSLVQAATGNAMTGALGSPSTKIMVLTAANTNVTGLAGLFHLRLESAGYQPDTCSPGGALVLNSASRRAPGVHRPHFYVTQTMDQLRISPPSRSPRPRPSPVVCPRLQSRQRHFRLFPGGFRRPCVVFHRPAIHRPDELDS